MKIEKFHPQRVDYFTDQNDGKIGTKIMQLRYDKTLEVVRAMKLEAFRQSQADSERGRFKLATALGDLFSALHEAEAALNEVCKICQPCINAEIEALDEDNPTT